MSTKLSEYIRQKYIGINISDGQLTATEINLGTFINEDVSKVLPSQIWQNPAALRTVIKRVFKAAGIRIWSFRPVTVFCTPVNTGKKENKKIYEAIKDAGAKSVYLLDDFLLAAFGTGVHQKNEGPVYHKRIYVLVQKENTYLGVILGGGTFELRTIPKGYDILTKEDIQAELKQLITNFPTDPPDVFQHRAITKTVTEELENAWRRKPEKQVYITAPERFKGKWGELIEGYWLVYTGNGEQAIIKGIEEFLPAVVVKKYLFGTKPINSLQIYSFLILLILIVLVFLLRR
jgi:hypothetical protein